MKKTTFLIVFAFVSFFSFYCEQAQGQFYNNPMTTQVVASYVVPASPQYCRHSFLYGIGCSVCNPVVYRPSCGYGYICRHGYYAYNCSYCNPYIYTLGGYYYYYDYYGGGAWYLLGKAVEGAFEGLVNGLVNRKAKKGKGNKDDVYSGKNDFTKVEAENKKLKRQLKEMKDKKAKEEDEDVYPYDGVNN